MELLEERIRRDGVVKSEGVLKVDSFLNHQLDIDLFDAMGEEFKRLFADAPITKILTIEASGIGIACVVARLSLIHIFPGTRARLAGFARQAGPNDFRTQR